MKYSYKLVRFCEIDKFASASFCAIHKINPFKNLCDITKIDLLTLPYINFLVGGSPCQDFSISGNKRGSMFKCMDCSHEYNPLTVHHTRRDRCPNCGSQHLEKTRSSLLVHWLKVLYATRPKVALFENVKNLVGKGFKEVFDLFIAEIEEYGYNVYYKVLNAKDYGIPQNRERVYVIAIRKDLDNLRFKFPEPIVKGKEFNDILDDPAPFFEGTDERIVIDDKIMNSVKRNIIRDKELIVSSDKNIFRMECPTAFQDNVVGLRCTPTLTAGNHSTIVLQKAQIECQERYLIKKLTASEALRMTGFTAEDYKAASAVVSDSQIYKQAGNSIVVNVLYAIVAELFISMPYLFENVRLLSTFSGIGAFERAIETVIDKVNAFEEGGVAA